VFSRAWWLLALSVTACDVGSLLGDESAGSTPQTLEGRPSHDVNTLIVGRAADAIYLDPALPTDNESVEVLGQIYDSLLQYRPGSAAVEPGLATEWSVSDRGRTWTFKLRQGVKFHDGTPFTADAVVFSLERQRDPFHPAHNVYKPITDKPYEYWDAVFQNIEKVEKVDDFTVKITIERPYAPFLANMAMFPVSIISPTALEKSGADFTNRPVGTGPFKLTKWDSDQRIVLERNDDYWGEPASFQRVIFQVIADPRQRLIALESGAIDIAHSILPEELQFVRLHPELELHTALANNVAYLAFNTRHPPFDDIRVRRAANFAINKTPIVKLTYQGLADPATGPLPPTQWGYHEVDEKYEYDAEEARALIASAREDGRFRDDMIPERGFRLYVPSAPRPYLPDPERIARVLASNLREVGIPTQILTNDFKTHLALTRRGEHDLCLLGWVGDNGDPDNFLFVLFDDTPENVAFYTDPEVHGLLIMAQESDDRQEREQLYRRVQELIADQAPWVPLAHSQIAVAARDDILSVVINPSGHLEYERVRRGSQ
jgi:peptide/nickel transport system substrate-binding protein